MKTAQNPLSSGQKIGIGALVLLGAGGAAWYFLMANKDVPRGVKITGYRNVSEDGPVISPPMKLEVKTGDFLQVFGDVTYSGQVMRGVEMFSATVVGENQVDGDHVTFDFEQSWLARTYHKSIQYAVSGAQAGIKYNLELWVMAGTKRYNAVRLPEAIVGKEGGTDPGVGIGSDYVITPLTTTPIPWEQGGNYTFRLDYSYRGQDVRLRASAVIGNLGFNQINRFFPITETVLSAETAITEGRHSVTMSVPIRPGDIAKLAVEDRGSIDLQVVIPSEKIMMPLWNVNQRFIVKEQFIPTTYRQPATLKFSSSPNVTPAAGTIGASKQPPYYVGDIVTLQAQPSAAYSFVKWVIDGVSDTTSGPSREFTITKASHTIQAVFILTNTPAVLRLSSSPNITPPAGVIAGTQPPYYVGQLVDLVAQPSANYSFVKWVIDGVSDTTSGVNLQFTITKTSHTIQAVFISDTPTGYVVTLNSSPAGSGSVTKTPDQPSYNWGTNVTFQAVPSSSDWVFDHWVINGASAGTGLTVSRAITSNMSVTAYFRGATTTAIDGYISDAQTGFAVVANVQAGSAPAVQSQYPDGYFRIPNLSAGSYAVVCSSPGYVTQTKTVTVGTGQTAGVDFALEPGAVATHYLLYGVDPAGAGFLEVAPAGTGPEGSKDYPEGTVVTITAWELGNYVFTGWSTGQNTNPIQMTMDQDRVITAYYVYVDPDPTGPDFSLPHGTAGDGNYWFWVEFFDGSKGWFIAESYYAIDPAIIEFTYGAYPSGATS